MTALIIVILFANHKGSAVVAPAQIYASRELCDQNILAQIHEANKRQKHPVGTVVDAYCVPAVPVTL